MFRLVNINEEVIAEAETREEAKKLLSQKIKEKRLLKEKEEGEDSKKKKNNFNYN